MIPIKYDDIRELTYLETYNVGRYLHEINQNITSHMLKKGICVLYKACLIVIIGPRENRLLIN